MSLEIYIPPDVILLPWLYQLKMTWIKPIERSWVKTTWYTKVEQMYEYKAYELRYGNLSSMEHGSICMKA